MRAHGPAHEDERDSARGPRLPRDRAVLVHLARMRVLTYPQLGRLAFAGLHRSRVSRRVSALMRGGWVTTWEDRLVIGGRPRYILPTQAALRWALRRLAADPATSAHGVLLQTMLGSDARTPLALRPGSAPAFLPHLREANDVLTALQMSPALRVLWASSWHRPLPNRAGGLALPQPDSVLVRVELDGRRGLIFGEHDRGTESLAHFAASKADRYRALAEHPSLLRTLTGCDEFTVWVTVACEDTEARITALSRLVREHFAARFFRFIPAARLLEDPLAALVSASAWEPASQAERSTATATNDSAGIGHPTLPVPSAASEPDTVHFVQLG